MASIQVASTRVTDIHVLDNQVTSVRRTQFDMTLKQSNSQHTTNKTVPRGKTKTMIQIYVDGHVAGAVAGKGPATGVVQFGA